MGRTTNDDVVVAEGLHKRYGQTHAVAGLDLTVPTGTVHGLLGPNGSGKTTAVRVLTTLTHPSSGQASVAGFDVVHEPDAVRRHIGLAGQAAALDEELTGRENLRIFGTLFHLGRATARQRADELLERFDLAHAADRVVKTYSGGMRRRLDLIASLIIAPTVLFLDEPTTGLDPRSRNAIWATIRPLVDAGTTVLLTTQYLDEADQLADTIAVINHGAVLADGTPTQLKQRLGGRIDVLVGTETDLADAAQALTTVADSDAEIDPIHRRISAPTGAESLPVPAVVRELDAKGVVVHDIGIRHPTLDEVFLDLTGQPADADPSGHDQPKASAR